MNGTNNSYSRVKYFIPWTTLSPIVLLLLILLLSYVPNSQRGARDDRGNPIIRDFYSSPLTASGNAYDKMLLAKLESEYTGSGGPGSSMLVLNMEQGLPVWIEWLAFNRVTARARKGFVVGPVSFSLGLSGGHMVGNFPPHEAFLISGTNSMRGYEEGAIGSRRSHVVGSGEMSFPLVDQAYRLPCG